MVGDLPFGKLVCPVARPQCWYFVIFLGKQASTWIEINWQKDNIRDFVSDQVITSVVDQDSEFFWTSQIPSLFVWIRIWTRILPSWSKNSKTCELWLLYDFLWRKEQDPDQDTNPDLYFSGTDPRIRIPTKMSRIHTTGNNKVFLYTNALGTRCGTAKELELSTPSCCKVGSRFESRALGGGGTLRWGAEKKQGVLHTTERFLWKVTPKTHKNRQIPASYVSVSTHKNFTRRCNLRSYS